MTTPERIKRRQLIEGALLIVIGLTMIFQIWYFNQEDEDQRDCVKEKFSELTYALDARSELSVRETEANKELWLIYAEAAGIIKDDPTQPLPPKEQERLNRKLVTELLEYQDTMQAIERDRKKNPLPPFPAGVCEQ